MGSHQLDHLRLHHFLALTASRIATGLLFVVAALFSGHADALIPKGEGFYPLTTFWPTARREPTMEAACRALTQYYPEYRFGSVIGSLNAVTGGEAYCRMIKIADPSVFAGWELRVDAASACPANSTSSGAQCQCSNGYVENSAHTACEVPPDPCKDLKGKYAGNWWKDQGDENNLPMKVGFSVCDKYNPVGGGQCVITVGQGPDTLCAQADGGWWRCNGPAYYTGSKAPDPSKCTVGASQGSGGTPEDPAPSSPPISQNPVKPPPTPAPGTAAPAPCPAGQAPGQFNGTTICAPMGSETPKLSGSGTSTTKNNSDGSSTTNTTEGTTKCAQGQCLSTTNNTNVTINAPGNNTCPAGAVVGTKTIGTSSRTTCTSTSTGSTTQSEAAFCKDNAKDKQCGGDGADTGFGGSCAGGFKATSDDAVINAMAEEQYRRNCKFFEADSDANSITNMARSGADGKNADAMKTAAAGAPVEVGAFDTSGRGWGTGCPPDPVIRLSWADSNFTVPFSRLCGPLSLFSLAGVLLTLMGSMAWVVGGKKQD